MERAFQDWRWSKTSGGIHSDAAIEGGCSGDIHSYAYRIYPPESRWYERCIALSWCSGCRSYIANTVRVPRDVTPVDVLTGLPDRDRLLRSETRLLDYLDRFVRRGLWPPSES